jgi:hypothetical protein
LRGDFDTRNGLIFRDKTDLVDFYGGISGQGGLQLFS